MKAQHKRLMVLHVKGFPASWQAKRLLGGVVDAVIAEGKLSPQWLLHLSLVAVSKHAMRKLNRQYLGKDYATDVLSFPARALGKSLPGAPVALGDLVVCLDVARLQALECGHGVRRELTVLLVHGVLHLLGYDHERSRRKSAAMAALEARVLSRIAGSGSAFSGLIDRSYRKNPGL